MAVLAESQLQQLQEHKVQGHLGQGAPTLGMKGKRILETNIWIDKIPLDRDKRHVLTKLEQKYHETLKAKK